jgi:uncharacterized protein YueI
MDDLPLAFQEFVRDHIDPSEREEYLKNFRERIKILEERFYRGEVVVVDLDEAIYFNVDDMEEISSLSDLETDEDYEEI